MVSSRIEDLVQVFDTLSDDKRLRVLNLLAEGEICICDITYILNMSEMEVMRCLQVLRKAGFVQFRQDEFWIYGIAINIHTYLHNLVLRHLGDIFNGEKVFVADRKRLRERLSVSGRCERVAVA